MMKLKLWFVHVPLAKSIRQPCHISTYSLTRPWSRLHIDYAGPFLGQMWLVIIDAHSKWLEVFLMSSTTSTGTAQCLREVFARFGLPERIVTDNAPNSVSSEFIYFLKQNGIRHTTSAPYHPATNGLAERAVRVFKDGTKKMSEFRFIETEISLFFV